MTNREIDALVAEHVMGLVNVKRDKKEVSRDPGYPDPYHEYEYDEDYYHDGDVDNFNRPILYKVPRYSTSISTAWLVVEKFFEHGDETEVHIVPCLGTNDKRYPEFQNSKHYWVYQCDGEELGIRAETAPMAICLAALKAKGVEVDS